VRQGCVGGQFVTHLVQVHIVGAQARKLDVRSAVIFIFETDKPKIACNSSV
jgi:hypothetical protein